MFQLSLIFSHFLGKLFALRQLTQTLMLGLILLLMASGEEGLSVLFLMLEFLTLVHHLIILLRSSNGWNKQEERVQTRKK